MHFLSVLLYQATPPVTAKPDCCELSQRTEAVKHGSRPRVQMQPPQLRAALQRSERGAGVVSGAVRHAAQWES